MLSENMTLSFVKTRTMEEYRKLCDAFIVENYDRLRAYAFHFTKPNEEHAELLLQDVCLRLLEEDVGIDFTTSPLALVQMMMRTRLTRFKRRWKLEAEYTKSQCEETFRDEKRPHRGGCLMDVHLDLSLLLDTLDPKERALIEAYMEGHTQAQLGKRYKVSKAAINLWLREIQVKLRERAKVLFQDVE